MVGKIVHLRKSYHFGPAKISMYLRRYHDLGVSTLGVWRILKRLEMNRLPASQRYRRHVDRWKRYEKPQPGHRVQIDVRFVAPLKGSRKTNGRRIEVDCREDHSAWTESIRAWSTQAGRGIPRR